MLLSGLRSKIKINILACIDLDLLTLFPSTWNTGHKELIPVFWADMEVVLKVGVQGGASPVPGGRHLKVH